ncbi:MAG: RES family NAD+ phosphorylase [Chloroflexi bacterium]|nr:RES family NAD+ phosphorylase [Chloroflexota bacterium]
MSTSHTPQESEFRSWRSYWKFADHVQTKRRFVWDADIQAFLSAVSQTLRERTVEISEGKLLWRAQSGIDRRRIEDDDGKLVEIEPRGFRRERMKPLPNSNSEGRVNPAGIPVLYMATDKRTAISEVRPWIGHGVSVAQFRVRRRLKAVDLSKKRDDSKLGRNIPVDEEGWWPEEPSDPKDKEQYVWRDIEEAFLRPVTLNDNRTAYIPTQILAELFHREGFDAVIYRSALGKSGRNVALFNLNDAEILNCSPYEVRGLEITFKQIGNPWFNHQGD